MTGARTAALAACLAALLLAPACSRGPVEEPWAAGAAATSREVDGLLEQGDAPAARAALLALVQREGPRAAASDDRRLVVQDAYFRLARLALAGHDARQAATYADAGLALGAEPHLFVANLLVARGAAREASGDAAAAAEDYHRALVMNEQLLREALPAP